MYTNPYPVLHMELVGLISVSLTKPDTIRKYYTPQLFQGQPLGASMHQASEYASEAVVMNSTLGSSTLQSTWGQISTYSRLRSASICMQISMQLQLPADLRSSHAIQLYHTFGLRLPTGSGWRLGRIRLSGQTMAITNAMGTGCVGQMILAHFLEYRPMSLCLSYMIMLI